MPAQERDRLEQDVAVQRGFAHGLAVPTGVFVLGVIGLGVGDRSGSGRHVVDVSRSWVQAPSQGRSHSPPRLRPTSAAGRACRRACCRGRGGRGPSPWPSPRLAPARASPSSGPWPGRGRGPRRRGCRPSRKVRSALTSGGQLDQVLLVVPGDQDGRDPGPARGQDLLADAADGEDPAGERDLAGHRQFVVDRLVAEQADQGRGDRDPGRGAVLGHGAGRDVDVDVGLADPRGVERAAAWRGSAGSSSPPGRSRASIRRAGR